MSDYDGLTPNQRAELEASNAARARLAGEDSTTLNITQKRRSDEERRRIVNAIDGLLKLGKSQVVACDENGVSVMTYRKWKNDLGKCGAAAVDKKPKAAKFMGEAKILPVPIASTSALAFVDIQNKMLELCLMIRAQAIAETVAKITAAATAEE